MTLTSADRDRLLKLLALLASDHAGERDAAALAATRLLRRAGLGWDDVIACHVPVALPIRHVPLGWRRTVEFCLRHPGSLRPWEAGFLRNLRGFARLSQRQLSILTEIAERLRGREAA